MNGHPTFPEFFHALHGYEPFPWQTSLADSFAAGDPPDMIDVPTAAGKSAIVDAHLWAAAMHPGIHPRRLFVVQNRRVLVDQIADRANNILAKMVAPDASAVLAAVAAGLNARAANLDGLCGIAGTETTPFDVHSLRGGMGRSVEWVARPDRVAVLSSTPDQVGSAVLHRAYLLGGNTQSMGAAMFCDSMIVLDEAHLTPAITVTLRALPDVWEDSAQRWGLSPKVIAMSATLPGGAAGRPICLEDTDMLHPVLARRLTTQRNVTVFPRKAAKESAARTIDVCVSTALADGWTRSTADEPRACALVVVNTVADAVKVHAALASKYANPKGAAPADVVRVTGRQSAEQRDNAMELLRPFLSEGTRTAPRDLIVVATQSVECGVDLDADYLVSVACPKPSLMQRLGRLNRAARHEHGAAAVIIEPGKKDAAIYPDVDAVYERLVNLTKNGPVDLSPLSSNVQQVPEPEAKATLVPFLVPLYVDMWASNLPDRACHQIAPFIHGYPIDDDLDVYVATRRLFNLGIDDEDDRFLQEVADAQPPQRQEIIPVSVTAFRKAFDGHKVAANINGAWTVIAANSVAPRQTVLVAADAGMFDDFGWTANPKNQWISPTDIAAAPAGDDEPARTVNCPAAFPGVTFEAEVGDEESPARHQVRIVRRRNSGIADEFGVPLLLDVHLDDVGAIAGRLAIAAGLPADLVAAVTDAAAVHDSGKRVERFQRMLNPAWAEGDDVLAKSYGPRLSPFEKQRRWDAADLPAGWRHEAVGIAERFDLVEWLIATHHGHGRPFWPTAADADVPVQGAFTDGWVDLRDALHAEFGAWRVAFLETLVRAADWYGSSARNRDNEGATS